MLTFTENYHSCSYVIRIANVSSAMCRKASELCAKTRVSLPVVLLALLPAVSSAEIIWNGDFSDGNFRQYHIPSDPDEVRFNSVPVYGRPIQYGFQHPLHVGNGDLLSLVARTDRTVDGVFYPQGPTRGGEYAAKFTIKNSANGSEPADCDGDCAQDDRRSQLKLQHTLPDFYNALPHMGERWVSWSFYLPPDYRDGGGGFGNILGGIKHRDDSYAASGYFRIELKNDNSWQITHTWSPNTNARDDPWQYSMFYSGNHDGQPYPRSDLWPLGLRDFPNEAESVAALQSVNIGGWTDWIMHYKQDHRGSDQGGTGFMTLWKREDSGPWIEVLHILPKETDRGDGEAFNHGIGYNHANGAGTVFGMYLDKSRAWNSPNNLVIYGANHKVGDENTTFSEMSPDGTSADSIPRGQTTPLPPEFQSP